MLSSSRNVIIIGDGPNMSAEYEELDGYDADICCVNRAGLKFPHNFDHWVSWHANMLLDWAKKRMLDGVRLHSSYQIDGVELWAVKRMYGGSGMDAIQIMLDCLGYEKCVLVGMPMTGQYATFLRHWSKLKDIKKRIRSMSGNTKIMFGYPEKEWLL